MIDALPYQTTLPAIPAGRPVWFKVTITSAGRYAFTARLSPTAYATYLSLYDSRGSLVDSNDDGPGLSNYLPDLTAELDAGEYFLGLAPCPSEAGWFEFDFRTTGRGLGEGTVVEVFEEA